MLIIKKYQALPAAASAGHCPNHAFHCYYNFSYYWNCPCTHAQFQIKSNVCERNCSYDQSKELQFNTLPCTKLFHTHRKCLASSIAWGLLQRWVRAYHGFFQEKDFSQVFLLLPTAHRCLSLTSVEQNAKLRNLSRHNLATQCREKILEHDTRLSFFG